MLRESMSETGALETSLRARIAQVEPLRKQARRTEWLRIVGVAALVLLGLALLAGSAVGSLWVMGNYVTKNMIAVFGVMLVSVGVVVYVSVRTVNAFLHWREGDNTIYVDQFREHVIAATLREALPGCSTALEGMIDAAAFEASELFAKGPDQFRSTGGFSGTARGAPFRGSVLQVKKKTYSSERRTDVLVPYLTGIFVQLQFPVDVRSTVRLVDARVYEGWEGLKWGVVRRGRTVKAKSGIAEFDANSMVVLDEGETAVPPIPESLYRKFLEVRELVGQPVFVSLNATGLYVVVAVEADRLPLEERLNTANRPEALAREFELIRRTAKAAAILREALP